MSDVAAVREVAAEMAERASALEGKSLEEIVTWAATRFAHKLTFATGFGAEGCVIIDAVGRLKLPVDLFSLDTGLLFPETYELWRKLEQRYGITIRPIRAEQTVQQQAASFGDKLWERDPDRCCDLRKVIPLRRAVVGFDAWLTAIRRDQTADRANAKVVERDVRFSLWKVNPLAAWSNKHVWDYIHRYQVPYNPLHDQGYPSIGCHPCTSPVREGEDPRAGRWRGMTKTECGLHAKESQPPAVSKEK